MDVGASIRFAHEYEDRTCARDFTTYLRHIVLTFCNCGTTTQGESAGLHTKGRSAVATS
jgi:hypothetical protein